MGNLYLPEEHDVPEDPTRVEQEIRDISRQAPWNLPECMKAGRFYCGGCTLRDPEVCVIHDYPELASYLRERIDADMKLRGVIGDVIRRHGRPMYWDIIAAMVRERQPGVSMQYVYALLSSCKVDFITFDKGVYGLPEWRTKGFD